MSMNYNERKNDLKYMRKELNKLKQKIVLAKKVLASHAKIIGELREEKQCPIPKQ